MVASTCDPNEPALCSSGVLRLRTRGEDAMSRFLRLAIVATLVVVAGCSAERVPADVTAPSASIKSNNPELFIALPAGTRLSAAEQQRVTEIVSRPWVEAPSLLRFNPTVASHLRSGTDVNYTTATRTQFALRKHRGGKITSGGADLWIADAADGARMHVDAVIDDAHFVGTIQDPDGNYVIEPLGGGTHIRYRINSRNLPPEHDPRSPNGADSVGASTMSAIDGVAIAPSSASAAMPLGGVQFALDNGAPYIKVLVVYTPEAAAAVGGSGNIDYWANLAVDQANQSYVNSYVQQTLLLTSAQPVSYSSAGKSTNTMVNQLTSTNDGIIDVVHSWRAQQMADVVIMLTGSTDNCGEAAMINASVATGFGVVDIACVVSNNYTFAHEIGHLQGARHNFSSDGSTSPYVYGHGYVDTQNAYRTIMSVPSSCGNCVRLNYWSNLNVVEPVTGRPLGEPTYANDASVLGQRAASLRDFVTPDPVFNVQQVNYGSGQRPRFTWQASAGATQHTAYRCEYGSSYCSSLFASYYSNGTTREVEDVTRTLTGGYPPCSNQGKYYVVASHPVDGVSIPSGIQPVVCLQ